MAAAATKPPALPTDKAVTALEQLHADYAGLTGELAVLSASSTPPKRKTTRPCDLLPPRTTSSEQQIRRRSRVVCQSHPRFAGRNQSGTFSGTFLGFASVSVRFDPLAFQPNGVLTKLRHGARCLIV
jgi:hypothetical protein